MWESPPVPSAPRTRPEAKQYLPWPRGFPYGMQHSWRPGFPHWPGKSGPRGPVSGPSFLSREACLSNHQPNREQMTGQLPAQLCLSAKPLTTQPPNSLTPECPLAAPEIPTSRAAVSLSHCLFFSKGGHRDHGFCSRRPGPRKETVEQEGGQSPCRAPDWTLPGRGPGGHHQLRPPAPGYLVSVTAGLTRTLPPPQDPSTGSGKSLVNPVLGSTLPDTPLHPRPQLVHQ